MTYSPKPGDVVAVRALLPGGDPKPGEVQVITDSRGFVLGSVRDHEIAPWTPPELLEAYEALYEAVQWWSRAPLTAGITPEDSEVLAQFRRVREIKEKM